MQKIKIDLEEIGMAMDEGNLDITHFLNKETGELKIFNSYFDEIDEVEFEEVEFDDSYELVPKLHVSEKYEMRTVFASTRKNPRIRQALLEALKQKRGLTQFRKVLDRNPDDLNDWYKFEREFLCEKAKEWLHEIGVEPE